MSIIPKSRPKLPSIDVRKIAQAKDVHIPVDGPVAVLAIRDYYRDSMGTERNEYNDAAWIILHDRCLPFNFSTDPSAWRRGMATLQPGVWRMIAGKHKVASPSGYPAFRQYGNVTVYRDNEKDDTGYFGINLHRGGFNGTSSEGCQTVPPLQWDEFRRAIYSALGTDDARVMRQPQGVPGKAFDYILVTRAEAEKILGRKL
jgi:lysozyme